MFPFETPEALNNIYRCMFGTSYALAFIVKTAMSKNT